MSPGTPLLVPSLGGGHLHLPMRTVFARPYGSMKGLTSLGSHKSGGGGIGGGGGTELFPTLESMDDFLLFNSLKTFVNVECGDPDLSP